MVMEMVVAIMERHLLAEESEERMALFTGNVHFYLRFFGVCCLRTLLCFHFYIHLVGSADG